MKKILLALLLIFLSYQACAELIKNSPIKAESDIPSWNEEFSKVAVPGRKLTECREVEEIPGAHLCLNYQQKDMNLALARTAFFIEGTEGFKGQIVSHNDETLLYYLDFFGGFDFNAKDLMAFYKAVEAACVASQNDSHICLSKQEKEIYEEYLIPEIKRNPDFVVITYSLVSRMSYKNVVTHEILHAQYFLNSTFREIADQFFCDQVSIADKIKIRQILSVSYDVNDELLMSNEFQAYILMANAKRGLLNQFIEKYQPTLIHALAERNLRPILIY